MLVYREQVFNVIPRLQQDTDDAIRLPAGRSRQAFGHFLLDHARTAGHMVLIVQYFEEYLAGDVVRVITNDAETLLAFEERHQVQLQEIGRNDPPFQVGEIFLQVGDRLGVQLDHLHVVPRFEEELGEDAHARPYFQHRNIFVGRERVRNPLSYLQILQEMLP